MSMSDERVSVRVSFLTKVGRLEKAAEHALKCKRFINDEGERKCSCLCELEKAWKDLAIS